MIVGLAQHEGGRGLEPVDAVFVEREVQRGEVVVELLDRAGADLSAEELRVLRGLLTRLVVGRSSANDESGSCP